MHVESVPNRGSHPTILLRQSYREGKRVRKRTLANLTCLPPEAIETLKRALRGEKLVPADRGGFVGCTFLTRAPGTSSLGNPRGS